MVTENELRILCDLTYKLTELKFGKCEHLCIENFAGLTLRALLEAVNEGGRERIQIEGIPDFEIQVPL